MSMIILNRESPLDNEEKLLSKIQTELRFNAAVRIYIPGPDIDNGNSNISAIGAVFVVSRLTQITSKKRETSFKLVVNFSKDGKIIVLERKNVSLSKIVVVLRDFLHNKKSLNDVFIDFQKI